MFDRLKAALRAYRDPGSTPVAPLTLGELQRRLTALEEHEAVRSVEWAETRQALDRMLRRAAALQSVDKAREENGGHRTKDQLRATLRAKGLLPGG